MDESIDTLQPVAHLNADNLKVLASKMKLESVLPGVQIRAADEHRSLVYLLSGSVEILEQDEVKETIRGDTRRSKYPLFLNHSNESVARIRTRSKMVRLEKALYTVLKKQQEESSVEINDVQLSEEESKIFGAIYQSFMANQLKIAPLPSRAAQLRDFLKSDMLDAASLKNVIQSDPVVAAKMIRAVNAPEYRVEHPFDSIQYAVDIIGVEKISEIVSGFISEDEYDFKHEMFKERMRQLYKYSIYIALVSCVIAKNFTKTDSYKALLAGLIHEIGIVPILVFLDENDYCSLSESSLDKLIINLRGTLGGLILQRWEFASDFVSAAEEAKNWNRDMDEPIDCCDIVIAAQAISRYPSCYKINVPHKDVINSCVKFGPLDGEPILSAAKRGIKLLRQFLV